ncbi:MAG: hypothetical protein QW620_04060 [Thermoplasmata archaeon]
MTKSEEKKHLKPEKRVEHKIKPDETIEEVMKIIEQLQTKHPDREFFLDGDEFAICSRPKKSETDAGRS